MGQDAPFVREIRLVANEHDDYVVPPLGADVVYPFGCRHEGLAVFARQDVSYRAENVDSKQSKKHLLVISKTTMATEQSRIYEGMRERYRS